MRRLITKHDNLHLHKLLGGFSILSLIYRYSIGLKFSRENVFDCLTMTCHFALALSGLFFTVPKKRTKLPLIIYEEYRLHAITFTSRCFFVFFLQEYAPLVVLTHHIVADFITWKFGMAGNTAVRGIGSRSWYKYVALTYSFYQFLAIASHLFNPNPNNAFNTLIAIQSSVFLMTLYKKKIIRGRAHMLVYSYCLLLSAYNMDLKPRHVMLTVIVFLLRVALNLNKYFLWLVAYILS